MAFDCICVDFKNNKSEQNIENIIADIFEERHAEEIQLLMVILPYRPLSRVG